MYFKIENQRLIPADEKTLKYLIRHDGEYVRGDFPIVRNYQQLKMFWAICETCAQNKRADKYSALDTADKVCEFVKLHLRLIEYKIEVNGATNFKTKSISYAKMSQEQWSEFFNNALLVFDEICLQSTSNYYNNDIGIQDDR